MHDWWKRSRFFFISLVIHFTLVAVLAVWTLPTVIHIIVTKVHEAEAGAQPFANNQHQSSERGLEQWEKLSDYKGPAQEVPQLTRQTTQPTNLPAPAKLLNTATTADHTTSAKRVLVIAQPHQQRVRIRTKPVLPRSQLTRPTAVEQMETVSRTRTLPQPVFLANEPTLDAPARKKNPLPSPSSPQPLAPRVLPRAQTVDHPTTPVQPKLATDKQAPRRNTEVVAVKITNDRTAPTKPVANEPKFIQSPSNSPLPKARQAAAPPSSPTPVVAPRQFRPVPKRLASNARATRPQVTSPDQPPRPNRSSPAPLPLTIATGARTPLAPAGKTAEVKTVPTPVGTLRRRSLPGRFRAQVSSDLPANAQRPASVGRLSSTPNTAPPVAGKVESRLNRPLAKARPVIYSKDSVGMKQMFVLRQADVRRQYIKLFGGSKKSESAVENGLHWLAQHQHPDGRWCLNRFNQNCKRCKHSNCGGHGSVKSDTAGTALGMLPMLGAGSTHLAGKYKTNVGKAWEFLRKTQKKNGDLLSPGDQQHMYSHCLATIAICELYGMTKDKAVRPAAESAIKFIAAARHKPTGGWRYVPGQPSDTSVVGWAVMALKSAEMADLKVPQDALDGAGKWLKAVEGNGQTGGTFGYQNKSVNRTMTAEGLLCVQLLGGKRNSPRMLAGAEYLMKNFPNGNQNNNNTSYFWYYGTQVMYHMQGQYWNKWNAHMRERLIKSQLTSGSMKGTWNPSDNWESSGGRLYATSMKLLILEVYYRHLPLYSQLVD